MNPSTSELYPSGSLACIRLATAIAALSTGLAFAQSPSPQVALPAAPATSSAPKAGSHHRISTDDTLEILVFQEADLTTRARVSTQGSILMPLIGKVSVKGRTVGDVADVITAKLRDGFLVNPQVTVNVISLAKRYYSVLGQVGAPGQFELTSDRPVTLVSAIARAGGYTRIANRRKVILKRRTSAGKFTTTTYDVKDLARRSDSGTVVIREGDIIEVPESAF